MSVRLSLVLLILVFLGGSTSESCSNLGHAWVWGRGGGFPARKSRVVVGGLKWRDSVSRERIPVNFFQGGNHERA